MIDRTFYVYVHSESPQVKKNITNLSATQVSVRSQ